MPSSAVRTFTDPDAYFGGIRNLQIDGLVVRGGEFRAKSTRIDLHRLFMCGFEENLPRVMKVTPSGRRAGILFATHPDQPTMLMNGIEISQGQIARAGLHLEWYLRSSAPCKWGTMSLTPEDLAAAGETIIGRELVPPSSARSATPPLPALSRLRKLHEATRHLAKTVPDVLAKPELGHAIEQTLVEAMVFCLADSHSDDVRNVWRRRAMIMQRLEEALQANSGAPLYVSQLCAAVRVSYPTLRGCCQEYLGMGPKRYLLLRRMHLARRALRRADREKTTVTEVATDYGFWGFGRFSVVYRSLFGESPSATLLRPPEDPRPGKFGSPLEFIKSG
jgi:AraC-like DNA-binding protein